MDTGLHSPTSGLRVRYPRNNPPFYHFGIHHTPSFYLCANRLCQPCSNKDNVPDHPIFFGGKLVPAAFDEVAMEQAWLSGCKLIGFNGHLDRYPLWTQKFVGEIEVYRADRAHWEAAQKWLDSFRTTRPPLKPPISLMSAIFASPRYLCSTLKRRHRRIW